MDEKYSDWLKSQNSNVQSFENDQEILHHKEKTVAIFDALVQCCQPIISSGEGDQSFLSISEIFGVDQWFSIIRLNNLKFLVLCL